ncbi:MAG: hypothetical protein K2N48_04825 [Muribaculaceae bacterium]|nr:hypothetical protein [Muribaculaceae bacterium]
MGSYKIYMHISPSGKVYVGQTSKSLPERWLNGKGYAGSTKFMHAIKKYGWDNIQHILVTENLTKPQADVIEIALIDYYQAIGLSYNTARGGTGGNTYAFKTPEELALISKKLSVARTGELNCNYGKHMSDETKRKLSISHTGKYKGTLNPMYGRRGKDSPLYGRKHSDETRQKQSESLKGKNTWALGTKFIHKDGVRKKVKIELVPQFVADGWEIGWR